MKQLLTICAALLSLPLLAGCAVTSPTDPKFQEDRDDAADEAQEDFLEDLQDALEDDGTKAHRWRVLDAEGQNLYTITDPEAVAALDGILNDDGWGRLEKDPSDPAYTYVYSQEKTLLAGQDPDTEREYEDLMTFTVSASEDALTMQILGGLEELSLIPDVDWGDVLTFSASVPAATAEALRDPVQFAE